MNFDPFDGVALRRAFVEAAPEARAGILAEAVKPMALGLKAINSVADLSNTDPESFVEGLQKALLVNPGNLTAARALLWFYIRWEYTAEAEKLYTQTLEHWKDYGELHLELIRTLVVDGSAESAVKALVDSKRLFRGPGLASYRLQTGNYKDEGEAKNLAETVSLFGALEFRKSLDQGWNRAGGLKESEQQAWWSLCQRVMSANSIVLVGNASNLLGSSLGKNIDSFDVVIRCNFPDIRNHGVDAGTRTDAIFFNETLRDKLGKLRSSQGFGDVLSIGVHPEASFGFPTAEYFESQSDIGTLGASARKYISDISYSRSTTGLVAINILCFLLGRHISFCGFDFFSNARKSHYFGSQVGAYLGHELRYERYFVTKFLAQKFHTRAQLVRTENVELSPFESAQPLRNRPKFQASQ